MYSLRGKCTARPITQCYAATLWMYEVSNYVGNRMACVGMCTRPPANMTHALQLHIIVLAIGHKPLKTI